MSYYDEVLAHIAETPGLSYTKLIRKIIGKEAIAVTGPEGNFGNVYIRPMVFPEQGHLVSGHSHNFDHVTFISRGSLLVRIADVPDIEDCAFCEAGQTPQGACTVCRGKGEIRPKPVYGPEQVLDGGHFLLIKAQKYHEFTCLSDNALAFCVYSHRDPETGEVVDRPNNWMAAYG
tara:strand:+ start:586 stop:1110 length:525 start_codon:yes stop_codon:yes gene_type:complete